MNPQAIMVRLLSQLRDDIISSSMAQGQKASGKTYANITVNVPSPIRGELWVPAYIQVLRDGRRPGKVPYDFEEILKQWAEAKGLQFDNYYLLARKIRREGTKLFRTKEMPDIFETAIKKFEAALTEELGRYYKTMITNELENGWK